MYDFRSRGLCSFGPCLASCFKKMRKWKTKEKKLKYNFNDGQQVEIFPMSGDLAIEVALDIEYRIGRAYQCAKKFLRLRTYFLHKSKGTLTLRGVL